MFASSGGLYNQQKIEIISGIIKYEVYNVSHALKFRHANCNSLYAHLFCQRSVGLASHGGYAYLAASRLLSDW